MTLSDQELLELAAKADKHSLGILFTRYRPKLLSMIAIQIDPRVSTRMDESDILQEVHLEAERRLHEYLAKPELSFYRWMRFLAKQKLVEIVRRHVYTPARDDRRKERLPNDRSGGGSHAIAGFLMSNVQSSNVKMAKAEVKVLVNAAIAKLDPSEREILELRHVDRIRTADASARLGIS